MESILVCSIVVLGCMAQFAQARDLDKDYKKAEFQLGTVKFSAYVADDDLKREQGLMFIKKLAPEMGMLFVFEQEQPLNFWMKNTIIPLSIGFLDANGKLVDIQEMKVAGSLMELDPPTYHSRAPGVFALEMNTGWFTKHHVIKGAQLRLLSKSDSSLLTKQLPSMR